MADDMMDFNLGSWAENLAGALVRNWVKTKIMPQQPKMDYYFDKQFDVAKGDMTRAIAQNLAQRGMSGATNVTADSMRPISDLEAQRAYLRSQVDYQNAMQDYSQQQQLWNDVWPSLFGYDEGDGKYRMGALTAGWDQLERWLKWGKYQTTIGPNGQPYEAGYLGK